MAPTTILFVTAEGCNAFNPGDEGYDYQDGFYNDIFTGDSFVRWSGQKTMKNYDNMILNQDPSQIHFFRRARSGDQYVYAGCARKVEVRKERTELQTLVADIYLAPTTSWPLAPGTTAPSFAYMAYHMPRQTKNKMGAFQLLGVEPIKGGSNWCSGIMVGQ